MFLDDFDAAAEQGGHFFHCESCGQPIDGRGVAEPMGMEAGNRVLEEFSQNLTPIVGLRWMVFRTSLQEIIATIELEGIEEREKRRRDGNDDLLLHLDRQFPPAQWWLLFPAGKFGIP